MIICTDYKSKDKFSNGVFFQKLYDQVISKSEEVEEEIIWSDGPTSEFKNKFMVHLLAFLSEKHGKKFLWKFSATSHGKGVVDGVGGNVKSAVRGYSLQKKKKDKIIVQDVESFFRVASMKMKATKVFMVKQEEIELFKASDPFIGCRPVPGIMAMHVMSVMNGKVSLWKNALFFLNDHASLQITYSNSSPRAEC